VCEVNESVLRLQQVLQACVVLPYVQSGAKRIRLAANDEELRLLLPEQIEFMLRLEMLACTRFG
jgi:hypothetical protein